jgi:putative colanic acid biosynthesis glycosyltransferase WcaE
MHNLSLPLISILTVVRNDPSGLRRTITSALAQSQTNWELLIKDGNSDDSTADLAGAYAQEHNRISLVPGRDKNLYDAMNMALAAARGEYVICLNAGDEFATKDALALAISQMQEIEDCDIGFFSTHVIMENGVKYVRLAKPTGYIEYGQPAIHQSTIMRREQHARCPYDFEMYPNIADYAAVAKMIKSGAKAASLDTILSKFEITGDSSSFVNQKAARQEFDKAIVNFWELGLAKRICFRFRRRLAMLAVRMLMTFKRMN